MHDKPVIYPSSVLCWLGFIAACASSVTREQRANLTEQNTGSHLWVVALNHLKCNGCVWSCSLLDEDDSAPSQSLGRAGVSCTLSVKSKAELEQSGRQEPWAFIILTLNMDLFTEGELGALAKTVDKAAVFWEHRSSGKEGAGCCSIISVTLRNLSAKDPLQKQIRVSICDCSVRACVWWTYITWIKCNELQ